MARFVDNQKQMAFFYAEQDAACYDDTVEMTQRFYWQFHDVIADLFRYHFDAWTPETAASVVGSVLDVGCGTGVEALRLLDAFPSIHLIGLDFCQPMLEQLERKLIAKYGTTEWRRRCTLSLVDILDERLRAETVLAVVPRVRGELQAIVTAFALHHYTAEDKLRAYRLFFDLLPPGGLLVQGDLFSFESPTLASYAQVHEERWIVDRFSHPGEEVRVALGTMAKTTEELQALWIEHLRKYNHPLAIEQGWSRDVTRDATPIDSEVQLLRSAGFLEIGCPYRYFQAGVLWARR
jgi:SAM-dependent methyltransferase